MRTSKRIKALLLLGVMLLGLVISGCAPEQGVEPSETEPSLNTVAFPEMIDSNNIEKIVIYLHVYSSVKLDIDNQNDLQTVVDILNSDKEQMKGSFDFSLNDVNYLIDVIYKNKAISIKIISNNNDIYYILEDCIYKCSRSNHLLLTDFIWKKIIEIRSDSGLDYIEK